MFPLQGKRIRKQVNYSDTMQNHEEESWNNDLSDFDTDFSGEHGDDDDNDFDGHTDSRGRRRGGMKGEYRV